MIIFTLFLCFSPSLIGILNLTDQKTLKEEVVEFEHKLNPNGTLEVLAHTGKITISGWDKDLVYVKAVKQAPAKSLPSLLIETNFTDNSAHIRTLTNGCPNYTYSYSFLLFNYSYSVSASETSMIVDYKIKVPRNTSIKVISAKDSPLRIKNIDNQVFIKNYKGDIKTDEIGGPLKIETEYGDVRINDSNDQVNLVVYDGDIKVNNVSESLSIVCDKGAMDINNVKGAIQIKGRHSPIRINNAYKQATLDIVQGDIYINNIQDALSICSKRGYIKVQKAESTCKIITDDGPITLSQKKLSVGDTINLQNSYGDIRLSFLKHVDAHLCAQTEKGSIAFDRSLTDTYQAAKNIKNLNIALGKPIQQECTVTVKTSEGNIKIASS